MRSAKSLKQLGFCDKKLIFAKKIAGGVALTVMTGGVAAVVAGGIAVGGGASMITNPISKVFYYSCIQIIRDDSKGVYGRRGPGVGGFKTVSLNVT